VTFFLADDDIIELRRTTSENIPSSKYDPPVLDILYEDDSIMVINKSAHMNVHPGDHKTDEGSLIEYVHDLLAGRHDSLTFRPALVHRIDRDTSGVILIAKEKKALDILL
jgi:23S rRNA-/tRNA-specific pseudouridylate synthase